MHLWTDLYNLLREAHRHSLHEPFSLAVNLLRNIKPRRVFANHWNKQPLVTSAWRHGKHRYNIKVTPFLDRARADFENLPMARAFNLYVKVAWGFTQ